MKHYLKLYISPRTWSRTWQTAGKSRGWTDPRTFFFSIWEISEMWNLLKMLSDMWHSILRNCDNQSKVWNLCKIVLFGQQRDEIRKCDKFSEMKNRDIWSSRQVDTDGHFQKWMADGYWGTLTIASQSHTRSSCLKRRSFLLDQNTFKRIDKWSDLSCTLGDWHQLKNSLCLKTRSFVTVLFWLCSLTLYVKCSTKIKVFCFSNWSTPIS